MRLFGGGTYLDEDDEAWQVETWTWFLKEFGGLAHLRRTPLVTPTREFFPPTEATGEQRAEHIFECVRRLAGMEHWPCRLIAQPARAELRVGDVTALKPIGHAPAGTFSIDGNGAVISYEPSNVSEPLKLIATFSHELAHYRLSNLRREIPGGEEVHEYATDLMSVYLGFGLFHANSAFSYSQHQNVMSQGWKYSHLGYLGERGFTFALAVFLELKGQSSDDAKSFLKAHLFSELGKARRHIAKRGLLSSMLS
jgi:hypothetical protein